MKLTIDTDKISSLEKKGKEIIFKPEAEQSLVALLDLQEKVDEAVETVKEYVLDEGQKLSEDFKGIVGDQISCYSRVYGSPYKTTEDTPKEFMQDRAYLDTKKVAEYEEENDQLPDGVEKKARKIHLVFQRG